jgi:hypothetical protein
LRREREGRKREGVNIRQAVSKTSPFPLSPLYQRGEISLRNTHSKQYERCLRCNETVVEERGKEKGNERLLFQGIIS